MSKMRIATLGAVGALLALPALAQTVKVTPLGGVDGEFCIVDRALVFEDPNGTRILYDPGFTVAGGEDPRLGKIDIILVSHMHADHLGNAHAKAPNSGSCDGAHPALRDDGVRRRREVHCRLLTASFRRASAPG